jgi:quinol monooxygenase YgiN
MIVTARLKAKAGKEGRMEELLCDMVTKVSTEPGAQAYTVHRSMIDPTLFLIYERYTDQKAFESHAGSAHFAALNKAMGEIIDGAPDIHLWEEKAAIKK